MIKTPYNWKQFHSYRVFDEFLERFIIQRKSYVTTHERKLNLAEAFDDIQERFIDAYDNSKEKFDTKVAVQFEGASEQTKIVFANVEYLWAMPVETISPEKKRSYAQRWFKEPQQVVTGKKFFFTYPDVIANPGPWYTRNKYWEVIATLRVLSLICKENTPSSLSQLKEEIANICHSSIYQGVSPEERFAVTRVCGVHSAFMHLSAPERYEPIISSSHREQICGVFGHLIDTPSPDTEVLLKQIREKLYPNYGNDEDQDFKYRWFFYSKDIQPLWINKKTKQAQRASSAIFDIRLEEDTIDLEGEKKEVRGYRIQRSAKLVREIKERDKYTCVACEFHFQNQIVHVHHLDPISEYERPQETLPKDLITLCPNCHYIAHYHLRKKNGAKYKDRETLLEKLRS